jgi:hypothetical protein
MRALPSAGGRGFWWIDFGGKLECFPVCFALLNNVYGPQA